MLTAMQTPPLIRSVGPPPQQHADRVVAEMLRLLIRARTETWDAIKNVAGCYDDGNPRAQQKLVERIKKAGGIFTPFAVVQPGKRGRYSLKVYFVDGWDATRKEPILPGEPIPERPWLSGTILTREAKGNYQYDTTVASSLFFTHHALSRLTQRCGARSVDDLIKLVHNIWAAYILASAEDDGDRDWEGYRLKFKLSKDTHAYAVLSEYDDGQGGIVVATVIEGNDAR